MRTIFAAVVFACVFFVAAGAVCAAEPAATKVDPVVAGSSEVAADPAPAGAGRADRSMVRGLTAESIFRGLPASIFDNTFEPISEEAKQKLLEFGYISNWVILDSHPQFMRMSAVSDYEGEVSVQLFPGAEGGVAVLAARTGESCAAELWRYDRRGRSVPEPEPEAPLVSDYFTAGRKLSPVVTPSARFCLEGAELEAKPLFWGPSGLMEILPDNRAMYAWDGERFIKAIVPAEGASSAGDTASGNGR